MKIRSGGQTGADRGGLKAALAAGCEIWGWCPKGRRAEDGSIPEIFPMKETPSSDYPQRTEWNVRDSDGTVIFAWGSQISPGCKLTIKMCRKYKKPFILIEAKSYTELEIAEALTLWLQDHSIGVLNVAGSRESKAAGIEGKVERAINLTINHIGLAQR